MTLAKLSSLAALFRGGAAQGSAWVGIDGDRSRGTGERGTGPAITGAKLHAHRRAGIAERDVLVISAGPRAGTRWGVLATAAAPVFMGGDLVRLPELPHRISIYRLVAATAGGTGRRRMQYTAVAEDVPALLSAEGGDVTPAETGPDVSERWRGVVLAGVDLRPTDRVRVLGGGRPARFVVREIAPDPDAWDTAFGLDSTEEVFP